MSTHEHLEHAEHAEHAAHNPFDRKVAMTMAIVAAALACIVMLSHREHNETLLLQNEAGIRQTRAGNHLTNAGNHLTNVGNYLTDAGNFKAEAGVYQTKASNQWNYYQAKNNLRLVYSAYLLQSGFLATAPGKEEAVKKAQDSWASEVSKYDSKLPIMKKEAEELEAKAREHQAKADEFMAKAKKEQQLAKEDEHKVKEEEKQVAHFTELSHLAHARSTRFDLGELGIELALVLCSIAVLTKRAAFWYSGMGIGVVGAVVGVSAFLMSHGTDHADAHAPAGQHAPETPGKSGGGH
jgi:hypothetical protein